MLYDVANRDRYVRAGGVKYLSEIVEKIAVMEGELFSGVTYCGWGVPKHFVDAKEKEDLFCRSVESMKQVMKVAEREGVTVCCEAVNRFESLSIIISPKMLNNACFKGFSSFASGTDG